jgi:L-lactate utilization protein LutC
MTEERFTTPASDERVAATAAALSARGHEVFVVDNLAEAKAKALELIPEGAQVQTAQSATNRALGLFEAIDESGKYDAIRPQAAKMDRVAQAREWRQLTGTPDVIVGSVHAITEDGRMVAASFGGAQLGPYVSGAGKVIWVVGTQKIVKDLDEAFERIEKHALPLESERLQKLFGIPSAINKLLIVNGERPGRTTVILIKEAVGF